MLAQDFFLGITAGNPCFTSEFEIKKQQSLDCLVFMLAQDFFRGITAGNP